MRIVPRSESISRRDFVRGGSALATAVVLGRLADGAAAAEQPAASVHKCRPLLTAALDFEDVSRGHPKPYDLTGAALEAARLTPQSWRLEIVADPFTDEHVKDPASLSKQFAIEDGTALDLPALMELGRNHGARFIKAMQCMNLSEPLGQGLWEGVPLREALRLCGPLRNVRRIYYWGFHNNDPGQLFQSSLSFTEVMETAPGELPAFLAYRLNGEPIPLKRGGPVRMIVPWSHGFKSIKWLQRISLTNDFRANDTYANANNDPDSHLKTAAYILDAPKGQTPGQSVTMSGIVISGLSGLRRVEYLLRRVNSAETAAQDGGADDQANWIPCELEAPPSDWGGILPAGVSSKEVLGFDPKTGQPATWPLRYSMISWFVTLKDLKPGNYEFRARSVDLNGFAQPEPRPLGKTGKNAVESARFEVM
jgi:DMSO/TMAO reductase YedYZ molybdopterin-dependent catalytic subunit